MPPPPPLPRSHARTHTHTHTHTRARAHARTHERTHARTQVSLGHVAGSSDSALQAQGVHIPLPLKALEYFDEFSNKKKDMVNFAEV